MNTVVKVQKVVTLTDEWQKVLDQRNFRGTLTVHNLKPLIFGGKSVMLRYAADTDDFSDILDEIDDDAGITISNGVVYFPSPPPVNEVWMRTESGQTQKVLIIEGI